MSAAHFEAKLYALRKSKDGVIVSFVCHPSDVKSDLMNLDIGAHLMIGWSEIDEQPGGTKSRAASAANVNSPSTPVASEPDPPRETIARGKALTDARKTEDAAKPKRQFKDLSYPEQAGIRCNDPEFSSFLSKTFPEAEMWGPAEYIRRHCGVKSRAELSTNRDALNSWRALEAAYQRWVVTQQYAESIRR